MPTRWEIGRIGELLASRYLERLGYTIIERNFRIRGGEIDIICQNTEGIVFVEVKTRTNCRGGYPEEAVSQRKRQRLALAIATYLNDHPISLPPRVDIISILLDRSQRPTIFHVPNLDLEE